ncbi:MAG: peptide chain release factor N(5)-glutamine methyltransferase [Candidatus Marinimicrobia bacterium]|nr:peptide chain release factor N(5)-glutamine methyltransferase [Candidatus Neomarinimicrobiota bacterium]
MTAHSANPAPTAANRSRVWTILDLINWGREYFEKRQIDNARLEVEWLLAQLLSLKRVDLYVQFEQPLEPAELAQFKQMVLRRVSGEPLQYILGTAPFCEHDFLVTPAVLIPRPESEILIERLKQGPAPATILDIGTGSGCLAVTAALLFPAAQVTAVDISPDALEVARENADQLGAENVTFMEMDILQDDLDGTFDVVICNPPYISESEWELLPQEVREREPEVALRDRGDGLTFFRRLAEIGPALLTPQGQLIIEIGGRAQAGAVEALFTAVGATCSFYPDLQDDLRVGVVRWGD